MDIAFFLQTHHIKTFNDGTQIYIFDIISFNYAFKGQN